MKQMNFLGKMMKTMIIHESEFLGLTKIVSGGQCGADRGALVAARNANIQTGGVAPKGYRTQFGPALELAKFGLTEDSSSSYVPRTRLNVQNADGTVIIASNIRSPGTLLTIECARKYNKPLKVISVQEKFENGLFETYVLEIVNWIIENRISILNVAGNRDTFKDHFHRYTTVRIISSVLRELKSKGLLINKV